MSEQQLDMIEEDSETASIPTEQAAFVASLEAEEQEADFDPDEAKAEEKAQEEQAAIDEQSAQMTAMMGLGSIEFALKRVIHPDFEFTPDTKAYAIENLSPALIKYGAMLPGWLASYDAEIKAAMAVGKLVSEGMDTARNLKAQEIEQGKDDSDTAKEKERVRVAA